MDFDDSTDHKKQKLDPAELSVTEVFDLERGTDGTIPPQSESSHLFRQGQY